MLFGLTNGPPTMMRGMKEALKDQDLTEMVDVYVDDSCTHTNDINSHLDALEKELPCLRNLGVKMDFQKCEFLRNEISFLGFIVSQEGRTPDPTRTADIDKFKTIKTLHDLERFMGFASYYRQWIPGFASLAKPLSRFLRRRPDQRGISSKSINLEWTEEHQQAV